MYRQQGIQQQFYTRDREGIFRTNEGFDTVAKSAGLEPGFIKNALHPYCVYKAPQQPQAVRGGDSAAGGAPAVDSAAAAPPALCVYHAGGGELVVGRSVFVEADFTGQRSAFFTHQFVIPAERAEDWVREPQRVFGIQGFRESYDIREGKELPELADVEYDADRTLDHPHKLLEGWGLHQESYGRLLLAVMLSLTNKRPVYIGLELGAGPDGWQAEQLMELLYSSLPYAYRRKLGFLTYSSEPEGKQDIHVTFVERSTLRSGERQGEKEAVFDLPGDRHAAVELTEAQQPLLDFIWKHLGSSDDLTALFDFCDEALQGMEELRLLSPAVYGELTLLFELEQGRDSLYTEDRAGTMKTIVQYLSGGRGAAAQQKVRLQTLFQRLLRRESADAAVLPGADYLGTIAAYEPVADGAGSTMLISSITLFIERAAKRGGGGLPAVQPLIAALHGRESVLRRVLAELYSRQPQLTESYLADRLARTGGFRSFTDELVFQLAAAETVPLVFFAGEALKKVRALLRLSAVKQTETAENLYKAFDGIADKPGTRSWGDLRVLIKLDLQIGVLEELRPEALAYEDVLRLGFMLKSPQPELEPHLSSRTRLQLQWLCALYEVLTVKPGGEAAAAEGLDRLGPMELEELQRVLKRVLEDRLNAPHFIRIPYVFYYPGAEGPGRGGGGSTYDYGAMLDYVAAGTRGEGMIYSFIHWSAGDPRFQDERGAVQPHYRAALSRYFDLRDPEAFRQKHIRELMLSVDNPSFAALFRELRDRQAPGWLQFVLRRRKQLLIAGVPLLALFLMLTVFKEGLIGAVVNPVPTLTVAELPKTTTETSITVTAEAKDSYDEQPRIYINGVASGESKVTRQISLSLGENVIEIKAENKYGSFSEPVKHTVTVEALPPLLSTPPAGPPVMDSPAGASAEMGPVYPVPAGAAKSTGSGNQAAKTQQR